MNWVSISEYIKQTQQNKTQFLASEPHLAGSMLFNNLKQAENHLLKSNGKGFNKCLGN